jgi:hypothetical protein
MGEPYSAYDDVVLVRTTGGEEYRVLETEGPNAMEFAEKIAREGVWITGGQVIFIPAHQVAHIELMSPRDYEGRGEVGTVRFKV